MGGEALRFFGGHGSDFNSGAEFVRMRIKKENVGGVGDVLDHVEIELVVGADGQGNALCGSPSLNTFGQEMAGAIVLAVRVAIADD